MIGEPIKSNTIVRKIKRNGKWTSRRFEVKQFVSPTTEKRTEVLRIGEKVYERVMCKKNIEGYKKKHNITTNPNNIPEGYRYKSKITFADMYEEIVTFYLDNKELAKLHTLNKWYVDNKELVDFVLKNKDFLEKCSNK